MIRAVSIHLAHPRLRANTRKLEAVVAALDAEARRFRGGCPPGELSIALLSDTTLARIHASFLDDPTTTDVITFEGSPDDGQAGEICVSIDTAERYALTHGRRFSEELTLYVVHGWLHLAGYDDLKPALKRTMRRAEARAMGILRRRRLLGAFTLAGRTRGQRSR